MSAQQGETAHTSACEQDDHERVFQAGREAGYRDALIALAERRGEFFDELDRNIADAMRSDLEYVAAHDAAVLRAAADGIVRGAGLLSPPGGTHPAVTWLRERAEGGGDRA